VVASPNTYTRSSFEGPRPGALPRPRPRRRSKDGDGDRPDNDLAADHPRTAQALGRRRAVLGASGDASTREKRGRRGAVRLWIDFPPSVLIWYVETCGRTSGPSKPVARASRVPRNSSEPLEGARRTPDDSGAARGADDQSPCHKKPSV